MLGAKGKWRQGQEGGGVFPRGGLPILPLRARAKGLGKGVKAPLSSIVVIPLVLGAPGTALQLARMGPC